MIGVELSIMMQPLLKSIPATTLRDSGLTLRAHQFGIRRSILPQDAEAAKSQTLTASFAVEPMPEFDVPSIAAWLLD